MQQIKLSDIKQAGYTQDGFTDAMARYRQELMDHRFTGNARPVPEQAWMENLIRRVQYPIAEEKPDDFELDFEIVDDTPPPPTLDEQKDVLRAEVGRCARAAQRAILPPGKAQLLELDASEAHAVPLGKRSAEQSKAIEAFDAYVKAIQGLNRRAAEALAEIDDLTADTIGKWSCPELRPPGA